MTVVQITLFLRTCLPLTSLPKIGRRPAAGWFTKRTMFKLEAKRTPPANGSGVGPIRGGIRHDLSELITPIGRVLSCSSAAMLPSDSADSPKDEQALFQPTTTHAELTVLPCTPIVARAVKSPLFKNDRNCFVAYEIHRPRARINASLALCQTEHCALSAPEPHAGAVACMPCRAQRIDRRSIADFAGLCERTCTMYILCTSIRVACNARPRTLSACSARAVAMLLASLCMLRGADLAAVLITRARS